VGKVYIYGLAEPDTGAIRYVGKTIHPELRMKQHNWNAGGLRGRWLNELHGLDMEPDIKILEVCTEENWRDREIHWIRQLLGEGADLLNKKVDRFSAFAVTNNTNLSTPLTSEICFALKLECIMRDCDAADIVRAAIVAFLDGDIVDFANNDELRRWQDTYLETARWLKKNSPVKDDALEQTTFDFSQGDPAPAPKHGHKINLQIAKCIYEERQDTGTSYKKLGDKYGISESMACRICSGERWPKASLEEIA